MNDEVARSLARVRQGTSPHKLESGTLDFKAPARSPRETFTNLADAAVCFANSVGGTIVLGVADRGVGDDAVPGTTLDEHDVRTSIFERTAPPLDVQVEAASIMDRRVLLITVPEGLQVYGTSDGRYS